MFRRVLVPTDFSEGASHALDEALRFIGSEGGYVELIHVVNPQVSVDTMLSVDLVTPAVAQAKRGLLRLIRDRKRPQSVALSYSVHVGVPWQVIVERGEAFDYIVMGSQGRSGLSKLLLGSVAQRVVQHAVCPVVTVRHVEDRPAEPSAEADSDVLHVMFENLEAAQRGLSRLKDAGVALEDVSIILRDDEHAAEVDALDRTKAVQGTTAGGLIGGSVGGILGGMAGMGGVVSGGLGLVVVGSALAFGAVSGLIGGLVGRTFPSDKAKVLRAELESGSALVAVYLREDGARDSVRNLLTESGGDVVDLD